MRWNEPARAFGLATMVGLGAGLAACAVGPDYERPPVTTPEHFRFGENATRAAADAAWWQSFGDPALDALVTEALAHNDDIDAAAGRVEQFYGALRTSRSALFPQVGYEASASRTRASEKTPLPPALNPYDQGTADFFATWELDLFGRTRRLNESARAQLMASEAARQGVVLATVAAVVAGYVSLREADRELEVAHRTLASRKDSLELFDKRFKGGVISLLELNQAKSEYAIALKAVPDSEQRIAQQEDALSVLVGRVPGPVERGHAIDELAAPAVPAGLPSELLERRPDLRQAEQSLISANAQIGAAKALYFPQISLTALFGFASTPLSNLFDGPARTWSFAGSLTGPIFTAGSIAGQVQTSEGARREAAANYQKAIKSAFQDTEDALIGVRKTAESLDAQKLNVESLRVYAHTARQRYEGGYTSYIEVLDAERSLFNSEITLAQSQSLALGQYVALYKALGGGWVDLADKGARQPGVTVGETPRAFP
jgi:multidrug efflux system outer membrane protein